MPRSTAFEWGGCPCSGTFENRLVEVRMTVAGRLILLTDVTQGKCPDCTSRVYKAETLARVEGTMKGDRLDRQLFRK